MAKDKLHELPVVAATPEAKYTIAELSKAKKQLGHVGAVIATALQETSRSEFTLSEAKEIVDAFASRPVTR